MFSGFQDSRLFRGTPHYPQRAKSSILTILTSHSKATQQNPPALQRNSTAHFRSGNPDNPTSIASPYNSNNLTYFSNVNVTSAHHQASHTLQHPGNINVSQCYHALPVSQQSSRSDVSSTSIIYTAVKFRGFLQLF